MTNGLYQRFEMPDIAARDRFECWRDWCSHSIDVPMRLEPVRRLSYDFDASAEVLTVGSVGFVEHRSGAAVGSWTRDGATAAERLRLMILAPSRDGSGSCYGERLSLTNGAAVLLGQTDGRWLTQEGLHGIQVNVPRQAVPVTDAQLAAFNDQRRLRHDPAFIGLDPSRCCSASPDICSPLPPPI